MTRVPHRAVARPTSREIVRASIPPLTRSTPTQATSDDGSPTARSVEALHAAIEASDLATASAVARSRWYDLVHSPDERVTQALDDIPMDQLRRRPLLSMLLGIRLYRIPYRRRRACLLLLCAVRSARRLESTALDPVERALIRAAEGTAFRLIGRPRLGVTASLASLHTLDELGSARRRETSNLISIYTQIGSTLYAAGRFPLAVEAFTRGASLATASPHASAFGCVTMLAGVHAFRGDLPTARAAVERARSAATTASRPAGSPWVFLRLAVALIALENLDPAAAAHALESSAYDPATVDHWCLLAAVESFTELLAGRPGEAVATLNAFVAARGEEGHRRAARAELAGIRSLLELALGSPDGARRVLYRDGRGGDWQRVQYARIELFGGDVPAALRMVGEIASGKLPQRVEAERLVVEAAALLRFGCTPRATGVLRLLGAHLRRTGLRTPLLLVPSADLERIVGVLEVEGYGDVVLGLPQRSLLADDPGTPQLTPRESSVLLELSRKPSAKQIAAALYVSPNTVKSQLRSIYRKLGVSSREEALAVARTRHLLPL